MIACALAAQQSLGGGQQQQQQQQVPLMAKHTLRRTMRTKCNAEWRSSQRWEWACESTVECRSIWFFSRPIFVTAIFSDIHIPTVSSTSTLGAVRPDVVHQNSGSLVQLERRGDGRGRALPRGGGRHAAPHIRDALHLCTPAIKRVVSCVED